MKRTYFFYILAALALLTTNAGSADAATPEGYWLTKNERSVIHIHKCSESEQLCGKIYWIIDGGMQFDEKNPKEDLQNRPLCGLEILTGFSQQDERFWTGGKIYKADDGDIYKSTLQIIPPNKLEVRGYIGMPLFGKSQTWDRVDATSYKKCEKPS